MGNQHGARQGPFNRAAHDREIHTSPKHKHYGARMYNDGAPSHTSTGNFQAVPFSGETYDTSPAGDFVDLANDTFDIPTNGYYDIRFQVRFAANATGRRRARIYSANLAAALSTSEPGAGFDANAQPTVPVLWRGYLDKGDVISFEAWQNSGGNLAYVTGADQVWAEIELVGV